MNKDLCIKVYPSGMNKDLCIKVYPSAGVENRPLLERNIRVDNSLSIDYALLIEALQILFGEKCIVTFIYF